MIFQLWLNRHILILFYLSTRRVQIPKISFFNPFFLLINTFIRYPDLFKLGNSPRVIITLSLISQYIPIYSLRSLLFPQPQILLCIRTWIILLLSVFNFTALLVLIISMHQDQLWPITWAKIRAGIRTGFVCF